MFFPNPGCMASVTSGRSVGLHLFLCPCPLPRTSEPVVQTPCSVGVVAEARGPGRGKNQTSKTPCLFSAATRDCPAVRPQEPPSTQSGLKWSPPHPYHFSPQLSRQRHRTPPPFFICVPLKLILRRGARDRSQTNSASWYQNKFMRSHFFHLSKQLYF